MIKARNITNAAQKRITEIHVALSAAHQEITQIEHAIQLLNAEETGSREQSFYRTALKELRAAATYLDRCGSAANAATFYKA